MTDPAWPSLGGTNPQPPSGTVGGVTFVDRLPIVLVALVLLNGCQRLLAPTPNLYVDAVTDPFADVPAEFRTPRKAAPPSRPEGRPR